MKKNKIVFYIIYVLIGIVLTSLSCTNVIDSFYGGLGCGLLLIAALRLIQYFMYKKSSEYATKVDVETNDERNIYLAHLSRSYAFYYGVLIMAFMSIVFRLFGLNELSTFCGLSVWGFLIIYYIGYIIIKIKH